MTTIDETHPWALYSIYEQSWWSNDTGWGHLSTAERYTDDEVMQRRLDRHVLRQRHHVDPDPHGEGIPEHRTFNSPTPDGMWVRVGDLP